MAVAHYLEALEWQREVVRRMRSWAPESTPANLSGGWNGYPGRSKQPGSYQR